MGVKFLSPTTEKCYKKILMLVFAVGVLSTERKVYVGVGVH